MNAVPMNSAPLSRRSVLQLAGLAAAAGALPCIAGGAGGQALDLSDPATRLRQLLRVQISLEEGDVPWWYTGRIYAVREAHAPLHLCDFEGCETYWASPQADGAWLVSASTLTFFRDRNTGRMLERFTNPITGRTHRVLPNRLRGSGDTRYAPDGLTIHGKPVESTPGLAHTWQFSGDLVWLVTSRGLADMPQPWLEIQSMFCPRAEFFAMDLPSTRSSFSSTYLAPWPAWMELDGEPGHVVWHASGRKLGSFDELPDEYRRRAEREYPGGLSARPE